MDSLELEEYRQRLGVRILGVLTKVTSSATSWLFNPTSSENDSPLLLPGEGRRLLLPPAILGFLGLVAIAIGVSQPSSPFTLKMPLAWFFGIPSAQTGTSHLAQQGLFLGLVAVYGGLLLLMKAFYNLAKLVIKRSNVSVKHLGWIFALWSLPLLVVPPLFSRDIYSYAAQGLMVSHGINPYHYGPSVLGAGPYVSNVDPLWLNAPAPYGPLFLGIAGFLAKFSFHNELVNLALLRLLEFFGIILVAVCVPLLARHYRKDPAQAFVLAVLNPLVLLHLVGGAHNDAIMVGLLVAGFTLAKRQHPVWGIVVCTMAAAIKAPAALGVVYIGWQWLGSEAAWRERIRPTVIAGVLAVAVMEMLSLITGLGWGWVLHLAEPGTVRSFLAPATAVGLMLAGMAHLVAIPVPTHILLSLTRVLGLMLAAVIGLYLLFHSELVGDLTAMGATFLAFVMLAPVVQPWYFSWGIVTLAFVAKGRLRTFIIWLSILSSFIGLPGGRQLLDELIHADPLAIAATLVVLLVIFVFPLKNYLDRLDKENTDKSSPEMTTV